MPIILASNAIVATIAICGYHNPFKNSKNYPKKLYVTIHIRRLLE